MIFKRYLYVYPSVGGLVENEFSVSDDILRIAVKESGLVCRVDFERTLLRPAVFAVIPVPEGNPYHSAVIVPDLHRVPVRLVGQGLLCDDSAVVLERQPQRKRTLLERPSKPDNAARGPYRTGEFSRKYVAGCEFDDDVGRCQLDGAVACDLVAEVWHSDGVAGTDGRGALVATAPPFLLEIGVAGGRVVEGAVFAGLGVAPGLESRVGELTVGVGDERAFVAFVLPAVCLDNV